MNKSVKEETLLNWNNKVKKLTFQGDFINLLIEEESNITWKSICHNIPKGILSFALKASVRQKMAFNANGMTPGVSTSNNVSEFEEILNLQRQGRQLSDMQLQSLDAYFQRRIATGSNDSVQAQFSHQMPYPLPPQQPGMNMPFQGHSFQHPALGDHPALAGFAPTEQFGANQSLHPTGERRRSSLALLNNFVNEMGYNNKPEGITNMERRNPMVRRTSLDLLGDAAIAVSNQEQISNTDPAASYIGKRSSLDLLMSGEQKQPSLDFLMNGEQKRSSLDVLTNGDAALARRNSLTHFLAQDFKNCSRRSSMAGMSAGSFGNPIDPYYIENLFDDQAKFAAAGLGLPNVHAAAGQGADMITLQLLQQQKTEEENALSNVEDYIKLQKLQTSLRRQSLSHMYDEMSIIHQMQNVNPLVPQDSERPQATQTQMEQLFQQQHPC